MTNATATIETIRITRILTNNTIALVVLPICTHGYPNNQSNNDKWYQTPEYSKFPQYWLLVLRLYFFLLHLSLGFLLVAQVNITSFLFFAHIFLADFVHFFL